MVRSFKNILLLSNLGCDCGQEDFRLGTYLGTILPLAERLAQEDDLNVRIMANLHIASRLRKAGVMVRCPGIDLVTYKAMEGHHDAMIRSYAAGLEEVEARQNAAHLRSALAPWSPDIVLIWESPCDLVRRAFPESLVLNMMPSIFMRSPYPQMIAFDPKGIYGRSWLANTDQKAVPKETLVADLRTRFSEHFNSLNVRDIFAQLTGGGDLDAATLLPLQISSYFGWAGTSHFSTQTALLEAAYNALPATSFLVCTQYTGSFVEERLIREQNIAQWRAQMPRLLYDTRFEGLDNFTQYLVPYAQNMISVSSTLGLQAKLFGIPLISPAISHLAKLADSNSLRDLGRQTGRSADGVLESYLTRGCFLKSRLLAEPGYLSGVLEAFKERHDQSGLEMFPEAAQVGNSIETLITPTDLGRCRERFEQFTKSALTNRTHPVATIAHEIVSFDVFDTLVYRAVLMPSQVFLLMQDKLRSEMRDRLPGPFIEGFASLRQAAEKALTKQAAARLDGPEEITIEQVYGLLAADFSLSQQQCDQLIVLEQEMELAAIRPRPAGRGLYLQAQAQGQEIILISDFIHDKDFVEAVLKRCGYDDWAALYVSSAVGCKKHSGALFDHVVGDLGLDPQMTLHIGDNAHGDVRMAQEAGWKARHLPSIPSKIIAQCTDRPLNISVVCNSVFIGAVLSAYGGCYHDDDNSQSSAALIATEEQLGFLTLGPAMYYFSRWLCNEARETGCKQIMLFGRDTVLAYRILKNCFDKDLQQGGLSICYIPMSRMSAVGLEIQNVQDLWSVRFDDFDSSSPIATLLGRRFMLQPEEIDQEQLAEWTSKPLETVRVRDLSHYAVYRLAIASAERHWDTFSQRLTRRQTLFRAGLAQWGCDTSLKTMAVDLGYKGTLSRSVQSFFSEALISRFFASYSDPLGKDPITNCAAFYKDRLFPQIKNFDPFLKYNLILETMLNENTGSAHGYRTENDYIMVQRDPNVDLTHVQSVSYLHTGAMTFARLWHDTAQAFAPLLEAEPEILLYFFSEVLSKPTAAEARLLAPLVFDNGFSGYRPRRVVELTQSNRVRGGLWREGSRSLDHARQSSKGYGQRWLGLRVPRRAIRFCIKWSCNSRLVNKFDRDPHAFFDDSKSQIVRKLGRFLDLSSRVLTRDIK